MLFVLGSSIRPRVDDIKPTSFEIVHVLGYDWRRLGVCDSGDLAIGLAYGSSSGPALNSQHRVSLGSIAVKWQDTFSKEHAEEPFGSGSQSMLPLSPRQDGNASSNLRLSDGGHEQVIRELIIHPSQDLEVGTLSHQFGHYISI